MMSVIVHFISRDKFTAGYIEFMKLRIPEYVHHFFTQSSGFPLKLCDDRNIHYYSSTSDIFLSRKNVNLLRKCSKIIVSGIWLSAKTKSAFILSGLVSKTYLHFWGGDFYGWRNVRYTLRHPRSSVNKLIHHCLIRNSAGTINLIEADILKLCEIFPNKTKHFTAPMPASPLSAINFEALRQKPRANGNFRILTGNSATQENQHSEILRALAHLREYIQIICPLSYGDDEYRRKVIDEGRNIFGGNFMPLTEFMPYENYADLLASCNIGIFNNNRQQAMGNISLLLRLGKKVYLRNDTSMWEHFTQTMKYHVYPVSELDGISLEELTNFPDDLAYNNIKIAEDCAAGNQAVIQWHKVLED